MSKKIIITLVIVAVIVTIGVFVNNSRKENTEYTTQILSRGLLSQVVDATGRIESADRIELSFKLAGQLTHIYTKSGDQVVAGQKLAQLDTRALESQVADAHARVNQAEADYQKLLAGASDTDIKVIEDTVEQHEQNVSTAEHNLATLKTSRDIILSNLRETTITVMNNELATAQGIMAEVDNILNDNDAKKSLSIKDRRVLVRALNNEADTNNVIDNTRTALSLLNENSSDTEILNTLSNIKNTFYLVSATLSDTLVVLLATTTSQKLSESELDALKSGIIAQQIKVSTVQNSLQASKANWTNRIAEFSDQISSNENKVKEAQKALQINQSQLALKKSPPRQFEIDAAQAKIDQANAALNLAQVNVNETIIIAPINGTIVKKNYEVGEQVSMSMPVFEMIGQSKLQIEVDIPESDIAKIKTSQKVVITLDALSDEELFDGTIVFIDPAETIIQDVVYYKVKVQLSNLDKRIKSGMTANTLIVTDKRDEALWVPSRVIKTRDGKKYVPILENGISLDKHVTTGLRGDQGIEITSGLHEGEEIITFVKE